MSSEKDLIVRDANATEIRIIVPNESTEMRAKMAEITALGEELEASNITVPATEALPFQLVERTVDLEAAKEEFATELAPVLRELKTLKIREIGRVLSAFMKIPVVEPDLKALQSMREHKLLVALIMLQDKKTVLIEAMNEVATAGAEEAKSEQS